MTVNPTPPGDNVPLYEGLDPSWNDIVSAFPEEQRAELAPKLKERLDTFAPLKQYEELHKSGVTAEQANNALNIMRLIDNNPRQVIDAMAGHLGLTVGEVQQAVKEMDEMEDDDPRISTMQKQIDTLSNIALAQRQQTVAEKEQAEADAALDKELNALKSKYGSDVDEEEVIMRMLHKGLSAEEAYNEYSGKVSDIRKRRPAPMLIGQGNAVPGRAIDPTKLTGQDTKNLVAQMLQHSLEEGKR